MRRPRPTAVTVMAIMNIVLGSLLMLCYLGSALSLILQAGSAKNPGMDGQAQLQADIENEMRTSVPGYQAYQVGSTLVNLALTVLLLVSGIGLLSMRRWARVGAILYAVIMIPLEIGMLAFHLIYIGPAMTRAFRRLPLGPGADASLLMTIVNVITVIFGMLLIVYAIILLAMMLRPTVRAAFADLPALPEQEVEGRRFSEERGPEQPPAGGSEHGIRRDPWDY